MFYLLFNKPDGRFTISNKIDNEQWARHEMLFSFSAIVDVGVVENIRPPSLFVYIWLNWCFLPFYASLSLSFHFHIVSAIQRTTALWILLWSNCQMLWIYNTMSLFLIYFPKMFMFVIFFNHFPFIIIFHRCALLSSVWHIHTITVVPISHHFPLSHWLFKFSNYNRYTLPQNR